MQYAVGAIQFWWIWFKTCIDELGLEKALIIEKKAEARWGEFAVKLMKEIFQVPTGQDVIAFKQHWDTYADIYDMKTTWLEVTSRKAVMIIEHCPFWKQLPAEIKRHDEYKKAGFCALGCTLDIKNRARTINPEMTVVLAKSVPRGDNYCEFIIECPSNRARMK